MRVTAFDVWRLARALRVAGTEIVEPCLVTAPSADGVRLDRSGDRYGMILRRNPFEPSACAFLMHLGDGVKRCGVYANRPVVCDVYPFELRDGMLQVRSNARCAAGAWELATFDVDARRQTCESYAADWSRDEIITAEWNVRDAANGPVDVSFAAYLAFGAAVCEDLSDLRDHVDREHDQVRDLHRIVRRVREVGTKSDGSGQKGNGERQAEHGSPFN